MAFVVSQGQLAAVSISPSLVAPAYVRLADDVYREYGQLYRQQPQIRTVVSFLARNIAQLGLHTYRRVSDTDRERLTNHPLASIFAAPGAKLTRYRLIERLVCDYAIYDVAYWVKVRMDSGELLGVIPIPPARMEIKGDNWLEPEKFVVHGSKGDLELKPDQVVHFHGYDPEDLRQGSSPIESLRALLAEEFEATRSREQMWRNGGRMSGVLKRPADAPKWDPTARARFGESWRAFTAGGGQAGGTPILEDGMEYDQIALDPAKAQYIEARKLTREEVAAAYHIPLPMVGILDNATFSNIKEQHQQLYQDTLGPWLSMIQEEIGLQLIPDLPDSDNVYVEFNLSEKLRGSFEEQASMLQTAVGAPWLLRNEARARMNLPAIDGGDEMITPLNVLVGGMASPTDTAPDPAEAAALPKARGRLVLMKAAAPARPDDLGDFEEEAAAFAAALERWTARHFARLEAQASGKADSVPDLLALWGEGSEGRLAELAALISEHGYRIAQLGAWGVLDEVNPEASGWDPEVMLPWLLAAAESHAAQHEDAGRTAVAEVDDSGDGWQANLRHAGEVWVSAAAVRAATASAEGRGFGSHDAAGASGLKKKIWRTGGTNPRASHRAQNGESVSLDDVFSNGLRWPGDGKGEAKETAGCKCRLDYATE
ncbi:phage portal protein [Streptomyces sp. NBC_01214]|uniref:phage portal protein n=1 Tax=Streptomyces sp. NBC_01214 TaxID=2903777 RepID=UPI002251A4FE|nr:phage portal protein [Streptomyces sp. NBC_01214]MCX4801777.1 phage portal protein [Streptomyces sp. NBC_01214]